MKNNFLRKDWIALMVSSIACVYYIVIEDYLEINNFVIAFWSILNLALVYRVVASISQLKKNRE
jgi:glucose uptake protein GlcU